MASASPIPTAAMSDEAWVAQRMAAMYAARKFVHPATLDPNYVPPNRGPTIIAVTVSTLVLAVSAVVLRITLKVKNKRKLKLDDWIIIPATVLTIAHSILAILMVTLGGVGKHQYDNTAKQLMNDVVLGFALTQLYHGLVYVVKCSILVFVYRLFKTDVAKSRIVNWIFIAYFVIYTLVFIAIFVTIMLNCKPAAANWNLRAWLDNGVCPGRAKVGIVASVAFAVCDVILFLLPMYKIARLLAPVKTRVGILLVMSLGAATCAAAIWKAIVVSTSTGRKDMTWDNNEALLATIIETNFAIFTCSLPAANSFFKNLLPKSWRSSQQPQLDSAALDFPDDDDISPVDTPRHDSRDIIEKAELSEKVVEV